MGHYLYRPGGSSTGHEEEKQLATALGFDSYACHKFDGGFAPGVAIAEADALITALNEWACKAPVV